MTDKLKILIVDDTVVYRKILSDIIGNMNGIEIVGTASNGRIALEKIHSLRPDLVTLDIEMPVMDGLETLKQIKTLDYMPKVIMVSSFTKRGAKITMTALELGAFDFIAKPDSSSAEQSKIEIRSQLEPLIKGLISTISVRKILRGEKSEHLIKSDTPSILRRPDITTRKTSIPFRQKPKVIAIGISTGGPQALAELLPTLPKTLKLPIVIVQHMPPIFTATLADSLNLKSGLTIVEAKNDSYIQPGCVYIAPGGKQMKIEKNSDISGGKIIITDDPPENFCQPSVDYTFRSLSKTYKGACLGIMMTGMGKDGVLGSRLLKRQGSVIFAQDEQTSVVFGMPMETIKAGIVDKVLPLHKIAQEIIKIIN